ncbi:GWxTD domain-containing protein [bacterium]|nr:GWxTD domain-containing protein [bacterium]NUN44435.1 GWxTD domain-containing protein [bacterium]
MKKQIFILVGTFFIVNFFVGKNLTAQSEIDSVEILKNQAVENIRAFERLPTAAKALSKIFGDKIKRARKMIERAVVLNPNDIELWFVKGVVLRLDGAFDGAETDIRNVIKKNDRYSSFGFPNVWIQLGYIYREKGEYDLAIDAFKQGTLIDLNDTWPLIELSMVFIDLNRSTEASEAFYGGLNEIRDTKNIDRLFSDCRDIATEKEIKQWDDSLKSYEERLAFINIFWKKRDPNPLDAVNERLIEHYKRLSFVRSNFSKSAEPWYDDRGMVYLRLGKPGQRYIGRITDEVRDNESWTYDHIKSGLYFDFIEKSGYYELGSLFDAVDISNRGSTLYDIFNERALINPYYQRMADRIKTQLDVVKGRAEEAFNSTVTLSKGDPTAYERLERTNFASNFLMTNNFAQDYLANIEYSKKQNFIFDVGAPHLPMNCNFASFRSINKKDSRLEFYYTVPFKVLNFAPSITQVDKFNTSIKLHMKLYDLKYNEVKSVERDFDISAFGKETTSHFFLDQFDADITPGKYIAAVEMRNNEKDRVGIYQFVLNVRDYNSDSLLVSDIEIAQYVDQTLTKDKYLKPQSNLKVVPNPAAGLVNTKPLTIYYEIYNLAKNADNRTSYQVSYSIKMLESNQSFLSSVAGVFTGKKEASTSSVTVKEGKSVNEKEYIAFDIADLPTGVAALEVRVKDLNSGKEAVSATNITITSAREEQNNASSEETVKEK